MTSTRLGVALWFMVLLAASIIAWHYSVPWAVLVVIGLGGLVSFGAGILAWIYVFEIGDDDLRLFPFYFIIALSGVAIVGSIAQNVSASAPFG